MYLRKNLMRKDHCTMRTTRLTWTCGGVLRIYVTASAMSSDAIGFIVANNSLYFRVLPCEATSKKLVSTNPGLMACAVKISIATLSHANKSRLATLKIPRLLYGSSVPWVLAYGLPAKHAPRTWLHSKICFRALQECGIRTYCKHFSFTNDIEKMIRLEYLPMWMICPSSTPRSRIDVTASLVHKQRAITLTSSIFLQLATDDSKVREAWFRWHRFFNRCITGP